MSEEDETPAPNDSHQFWAMVNDATYEAVRAQLDVAFAHPRGGVITCLPPVAVARHDGEGRPLLALENDTAAWPEVAAAQADLVAAELAEQITRAEWDAAGDGGEA